MEGLNRIISLILGLVVVIILFAIITGRINFQGKNILKLGGSQKNPTVTVTPTPKTVTINTTKESTTGYKPYGTVTPTKKSAVQITYSPNTKTQSISTIPSTGPEFLFPLVGSTLLAGIYLRKRS